MTWLMQRREGFCILAFPIVAGAAVPIALFVLRESDAC